MFPKILSGVYFFLIICLVIKANHDLIKDSSVFDGETSANRFGNSHIVQLKESIDRKKFFRLLPAIDSSDDSTDRKRIGTSRKVEKQTTATPLENDVKNENDHDDEETETTSSKKKTKKKRTMRQRTTKIPKLFDVNKFGKLIDALDTRRESAKRLLAALSDLLNRVDDDTKVKIELN